MADTRTDSEIEARDVARSSSQEIHDTASAIGGGDAQSWQGGINQGQGTGTGGELNDTNEADLALRERRRAQGDLVDDNAASHQGGFGAQGGQADYGSAGNLAGVNADKVPPSGSNPR